MIETPINADYSALNEIIETNSKAPKLKVNDRVRITKYKNICRKGYTENWLRETLSTIVNAILEPNPRTSKILNLNRGKITESFFEKELLPSKL